jgi:hypothetical protein
LWDCCLLARACRLCDWRLFPVKVGFAILWDCCFLDPLHYERWRRTRLRQRWSAKAMSTGCSCNGLMCNFIFFQGYQVRGFVVSLLYQ